MLEKPRGSDWFEHAWHSTLALSAVETSNQGVHERTLAVSGTFKYANEPVKPRSK